MSTNKDNRKHPRFSVQIDARIQYGGKTVSAVTKDMSHGGICLFAPNQIPPGSRITLSLALVLGSNAFSESLELVGRVVWCTPIDDTFQLGVVFADLTPEKNGYLDMFLRFLQQEILLTGVENPGPEKPPVQTFDLGEPDKT